MADLSQPLADFGQFAAGLPPSRELTHVQRKGHSMAQADSARTRAARYRQRVGPGGCSGVRRRRTETAPSATFCQRLVMGQFYALAAIARLRDRQMAA